MDQNLEKNKTDIFAFGDDKNWGRVEFIEEKISGKVPWRKIKIGPLLEDLKKGDTILLSEFSRLGRSVLECMEIISIAIEKGIKIYTVKGGWQLDNTIQSKVMAMVFSMAAEIERDLIRPFGDMLHPIPWQTDHPFCWQKNAVDALVA